MPNVGDVLTVLERLAPSLYAFPEDRIGLQIGTRSQSVNRLVTSLDSSLGAITFAQEHEAELMVCHHPVIWNPLKAVLDDDHASRRVAEIIRGGMSFIGAHTNWDAAPGGINDTLAEIIGLENVEPFGSSNRVKRLQLVTFVPKKDLQPLIDALSEAGAGVIGLYRRCAFYGPGTGTFLPLEGADPAIGEVGQVEEAEEVRLEMVVPESRAEAVSEALRRAHPYDEPAFHLHVLWSHLEMPIGRIGELPSTVRYEDLLDDLDRKLETRSMAWGVPAKAVRKVAVVGGAAADEWSNAMRAGADVMVTGEVPQHVALEASEAGFCIVASGHYATENPGTRRLSEKLKEAFPDVKVLHFEPAPGSSGRPV